MEVKFSIDDNKVKCFTDGAKDELKMNVENYTLVIIGEAERVEAYSNADAQSVITPSHVKQAVMKSKTNPSRKHGAWYIICQIITWITALVAGGLFDTETFKTDTNQMLLCIALSVVSTGCFIATLFADNYER